MVIVRMAEEAVQAGDFLSARDVDSATAQAAIPVNNQLFAVDPSGDRFSYTVKVDFTNPDSGLDQAFTIRIDDTEGKTLEDLREKAEQMAHDIAANYPERVDDATIDIDEFDAVEILFAERAY